MEGAMMRKDDPVIRPADDVLPGSRSVLMARRISEAVGILVFLGGCAVLCGWIFNIPFLKSIFPHLVAMKANTAIGFILIGVSLWLSQTKHADRVLARLVAALCAWTLLLIGLATCFEYVFSCDLGIDQMFFKEFPGAVLTSNLGRMAFNTAVNSVLSGMALLLLGRKDRLSSCVMSSLVFMVGCSSLFSFISYLYGVDSLYIGGRFLTNMAIHTALLFLLTAVGILFCRPDRGLMAHMTTNLEGGRMLRRLLPVAVITPIFFGFLEIQGQKMGVFSHAFGVSLVVIGSLSVMAVYFCFLSIALNRSDLDRRRMETALRDSETHLRSIIDAVADPIFVKDRQHRWVLFNAAFCDFIGHKAGDLQGKTDTDFFPPDQAEVFRAKDEVVFREKKENVNEESFTGAGGEIRTIVTKKTLYVDPLGREFIVGIIRDVSEHKRLEQNLLKAAFEWRRTFDSITDFVSLLDRESRILRVNRAMADALGMRPQDVVGKRCHELMHATAIPWPSCPFQRLLKDGKPHTEQVLGPRGALFLATVSPVFNEKQELIGAVHIAQDITVQKEAENRLILANQELRHAKDTLVQSEKMASIGQLAAGVAHEINNPVGFISNNIEVMTDYITTYLQILALVEKVKEAVGRKAWDEAERIMGEIKKFEESVNFEYMVKDSQGLLKQSQDGMHRIEKIVAGLKTFAREDAAWREDLVSIESVIEAAIGLTCNELKYHTELRKNYGKTSPVACDVQKITQVFVNLLVNAGQAIEGKGIIDVRTYEKDGHVCVDVEDSGTGITEENLKRIFDPFFTTKPVGKGTGLGLSISYEIVKKHNGEIGVVSVVDKGTTFTVMLPLSFKKQDMTV